jgi:HD superfamily phosphohydrolase
MTFPEPQDTTHADEVCIATRKSKPASVVANIDGTMYVYFHEAPQALNKVLRDVYTSKLSARLSELEKDQEKHAIKLIRAANATIKDPVLIPRSVSVYELIRVQETFAKYDALYKSKKNVTSYSKTQVKNALKAYAEEKSKQEVGAHHTLEKTKKQLLVKLKQYKGLSTAKNDNTLWKREGIYCIDEDERCNLLKAAFDLPQENKPKKPKLELFSCGKSNAALRRLQRSSSSMQ